MKKLTLQITFIAFIFFIGILCQDSYGQVGVAIGPKVGVSITTFKGADLESIENRTNWLGGVFVNGQFGDFFAIQPELLLSKKGAEFTDNNVRTNIDINYFEIPILAKIRLPVKEIIFPHILLGPNFSFRTNLDYSSYDTDAGIVITTNDTDIRKSDVGALVGAGVDIQPRDSGLFFTVDGRYGFGFNKLTSVDNAISIKNAGWSFSAGVGFLLLDRN